jgi:hypothetical protein
MKFGAKNQIQTMSIVMRVGNGRIMKRKLINKFECKKKHLYRWIRNTFHMSFPTYKNYINDGRVGEDRGWWIESGYGIKSIVTMDSGYRAKVEI